MKYTKETIIGLEVRHKDPGYGYRVVGFTNTGRLVTESIHYNNEIGGPWGSVKEANEWIENGTWIVVKSPLTYEIY